MTRTDVDTIEEGAGVAVLIPCQNEALSIGDVVRAFRAHLPAAVVYVYDNASTDQTALVARAAGAEVRSHPDLGKGNVVRRMFSDIEADAYLMVDGDGTYDAASARRLVAHLRKHGLDMVTCARIPADATAYRFGHEFGNRLLTGLVTRIFGRRLKDMLSGYRVMSRRFVKSFPALSTGFEIETEITVHALDLRMPIDELEAPYRSRPCNSPSKLRTAIDGVRILRSIVSLVKEERPLQFFLVIFAALFVTSIGLGIPIVRDFFATGLVARLPTAVMATGLMVLAFLSLVCGLVLDTVTRGRREMKRLVYLSVRKRCPRIVRHARARTHPERRGLRSA